MSNHADAPLVKHFKDVMLTDKVNANKPQKAKENIICQWIVEGFTFPHLVSVYLCFNYHFLIINFNYITSDWIMPTTKTTQNCFW